MGLYKRGSIWWARYRGERRSTGCTDKAAARAVVAEWERADADPSYAAAKAARSVTVHDACAWVLESLAVRGAAEGTVDYRTRKAGVLVRLLGAETPLASVTASTIDGYVRARLAEKVSRHTIAKELGTLRLAFGAAKRRAGFAGEFEALMPEGFSAGYKPRRRALTPQELELLLGTLKPHRAAWVAFAVATGGRLGEIERARREDVNLATGLVQLRGTKTDLAWRTVPVLGLTRPLLERAVRDADGKGGLLFSPWNGVHDNLVKACRRVDIESVSPNDLRRTLATWLRAAGVDASLVAEVMGHADSRMVERVYGRLEGAKLRDAVLGALASRVTAGGTVSDQASRNSAESEGENKMQEGPTTPPGGTREGASDPAFPAENAGERSSATSAGVRDFRSVRYSSVTVREARAARAASAVEEILRGVSRRVVTDSPSEDLEAEVVEHLEAVARSLQQRPPRPQLRVVRGGRGGAA